MNYTDFNYSVPDKWYEGVYKDKNPCRQAARPFCLLNKNKPKECWLLVHGYRGYPGELVHPAVDLFNAGFDVYVPRLPGHGTGSADFIRSCGKDWIGTVKNAVNDLKDKYEKVNLLGHSMGAAVTAIVGYENDVNGKTVYACPSFENLQMPFPARALLKFLSVFTPKVRCKWHPSSKYHFHYENAPCDEHFFGNEYFQWYFTKRLADYYRISKQGLKCLSARSHDHLVICPLLDKMISLPSTELYKKSVGEKANIVFVENATHFIFYDKDVSAEEKAVDAVVAFATGNRISEN